MTETETQLAGFFARYESDVAALGKALRVKLRARLPGLFEIVYLYETQGVLLFTYSPTPNGYDGLCSLAVHADKVLLHFGRGAQLAKADPEKLLQGRGKTVRHVALEAASDLRRPALEGLLAAALDLAAVKLDPKAKGEVIIKAEEQQKRATRAKTKATPRKRPRGPRT